MELKINATARENIDMKGNQDRHRETTHTKKQNVVSILFLASCSFSVTFIALVFFRVQIFRP